MLKKISIIQHNYNLVGQRPFLADALQKSSIAGLNVRTRTKTAATLKRQVCRPAKRCQVLRSNADFQMVSAFLHNLGRASPVLNGGFWPKAAIELCPTFGRSRAIVIQDPESTPSS